MCSEKQLIANQKNAQLSTGPKTPGGKSITASNAIKHGVFTKNLIVSSTIGKENQAEHEEILNNLVSCLNPQDQMQSLLVEKIAVDFWRMQRVLRFEAGSIGKYLEIIFKDFYSYSRPNNQDLEHEIQDNNQYLDWMATYVNCLRKGEVEFDQPVWESAGIDSDICDDFYLIVDCIEILTKDEIDLVKGNRGQFTELKALLKKYGFSSKKKFRLN